MRHRVTPRVIAIETVAPRSRVRGGELPGDQRAARVAAGLFTRQLRSGPLEQLPLDRIGDAHALVVAERRERVVFAVLDAEEHREQRGLIMVDNGALKTL